MTINTLFSKEIITFANRLIIFVSILSTTTIASNKPLTQQIPTIQTRQIKPLYANNEERITAQLHHKEMMRNLEIERQEEQKKHDTFMKKMKRLNERSSAKTAAIQKEIETTTKQIRQLLNKNKP